MSSAANVVLIIAVVGYVVARQFKARQFSGNARRMLILPAVLAFLALDNHDLLDRHHQTTSAALLVIGVVVEVGMGCVWGFTTRVWRDENGTIWAKGTKATAFAWLGMVLIRVGLIALGSALGVASGEGAIMLSLAALLLVRSAVVTWRAREIAPAYRVPVAG
ncbi:DUF1453 family protein [Streptacidiphilus sp. PB12-B1b]|uniref:CcdC protein domain-containing protein n=1 Tax=Streptacidiphilus sp. PB12-B1b TaxID=2705012 RepID=UPI0015FAF61F|nr:CcdC protein domain-containing protein [Streptacidiphilus sp. PB12-B1b]QMU78719.1 DUF1453 family protein [Streptacidiphilus sp. PB12-B1b]